MLRLATMFVALAIISASVLASNALAVAPSRIGAKPASLDTSTCRAIRSSPFPTGPTPAER